MTGTQEHEQKVDSACCQGLTLEERVKTWATREALTLGWCRSCCTKKFGVGFVQGGGEGILSCEGNLWKGPGHRLHHVKTWGTFGKGCSRESCRGEHRRGAARPESWIMPTSVCFTAEGRGGSVVHKEAGSSLKLRKINTAGTWARSWQKEQFRGTVTESNSKVVEWNTQSHANSCNIYYILNMYKWIWFCVLWIN